MGGKREAVGEAGGVLLHRTEIWDRVGQGGGRKQVPGWCGGSRGDPNQFMLPRVQGHVHGSWLRGTGAGAGAGASAGHPGPEA